MDQSSVVHVDYRELAYCSDMLQRFSQFGVTASLVEAPGLEFGDFMFEGQGEDGLATFAFERKKISEMRDCMTTGRLSGYQIKGLCDHYDYVFLVVEGLWSCGDHGEVTVPAIKGQRWRPLYTGKQAVPYKQLYAFIAAHFMQFRTISGNSVVVVETRSVEETVIRIAALYQSYQKPWAQHSTQSRLYAPGPTGPRRGGFTYHKPSTLEMMVSQIPGIDSKARMVAEYFNEPSLDSSLRRMAGAGAEEWRLALGLKGKKTKTGSELERLMKGARL